MSYSTGSHFVAGILASGAQTELIKNIVVVAQVLKNQIEEVEEFQEGSRDAALGNSKAIQKAEDSLANVEAKQAYTSFYSGTAELAAPCLQAGYRLHRDGNFFAPEQVGKMDADTARLEDCRTALRTGGTTQIGAGAPPDPGTVTSLTAEEMNSLRYKPTSEYTDADMKNLEKLRALKAADSNRDPAEYGKLYNVIDKKLNREEDGVQSQRTRYDGDTNNRAQYIYQFGQSANGFAQGLGGSIAAGAHKRAAKQQAVRSISDYAVGNQKTGADTAQQAFQNTAQLYAEEIRTINDIARANSPV